MSPPCPLCTQPGRLRQDTRPHGLWQCDCCDFAYVWPPMAIEQHRAFHQEAFFERYYGQDIAAFYREQGPLYMRERAKKAWMLQQITARVPPGRLLDVGAGQAMVDYLAREAGFDVSLVEINPPVAAYHRSQGFTVHECYLEEAGLPPESLDTVSMWHSLEHVFDPRATLGEAFRVLRPGGWLIGALPNWHGLGTRLRLALGHPLFDPATDHELHFSQFSPRALRRALLRAGFEAVELGVELHRPRRLHDQLIHQAGRLLSRLTGRNWRETMTFAARRPQAGTLPSRPFVRHRSDAEVSSQIRHERVLACPNPRASVLIPTLGERDTLPPLLEQLRQQVLPLEVWVLRGDRRQGRALNCGAWLAEAPVLITLDDDTRLADSQSLARLVEAVESDPSLGLAGGCNQIPGEASWLVRAVMTQIPRRSWAPVERITPSDLAEHPCLACRRSVFLEVGGENELLPRGLDPYLRQQVRAAGYQVVVVPGVLYHHLPPSTWRALLTQFFRNGAQSRYATRNFPEWVYETQDEHGEQPPGRPGAGARGMSLMRELGGNLARGQWVALACRVAYLGGWVREAVLPS